MLSKKRLIVATTTKKNTFQNVKTYKVFIKATLHIYQTQPTLVSVRQPIKSNLSATSFIYTCVFIVIFGVKRKNWIKNIAEKFYIAKTSLYCVFDHTEGIHVLFTPISFGHICLTFHQNEWIFIVLQAIDWSKKCSLKFRSKLLINFI